jgi:site-specific recombinase XerD
MPGQAVQALRAHHTRQVAERLAVGEAWQEHDLVFCREDGTPLDRRHVRKEFQKITKAARLGGEWTPRELRHSFVSILGAHDVRRVLDLLTQATLAIENRWEFTVPSWED